MIGFLPIVLVFAIPPENIYLLNVLIRIFIYLLALFVGVFLVALFDQSRTSVVLIIDNPPVVETTRIIFARLIFKKQKTLGNAVWVEVIYNDLDLVVQVGTKEYQTITVMFIPYSKANIPVAENICTRVASALHLKNKGYIP